MGGTKCAPTNSCAVVTGGPRCTRTRALTRSLYRHFLSRRVSQIRLVCRRFGSTNSRRLLYGACLPVSVSNVPTQRGRSHVPCCLVRPATRTLLRGLVPRMLGLRVCAVLLSSGTSRRTTHDVTVRVTASGTGGLVRRLAVRCGGKQRRTVAGRLLSVIKKAVMWERWGGQTSPTFFGLSSCHWRLLYIVVSGALQSISFVTSTPVLIGL